MFRFDVFWGSLGTSVFANSSSAANNARTRPPSRLSIRFLQLWYRKLYPTLPSWLTCACSYGKFSSLLGGIPAKSSEIPRRWVGSFLIWTHYKLRFGRVFAQYYGQKLRPITKNFNLTRPVQKKKKFTWSPIAPVSYSIKMQVSCIIGLKTYKPFRGTLKINLDDSVENIFWRY